MQNFGMIPFKMEGNSRNPTQKAKMKILQKYDEEISEYDF